MADYEKTNRRILFGSYNCQSDTFFAGQECVLLALPWKSRSHLPAKKSCAPLLFYASSILLPISAWQRAGSCCRGWSFGLSRRRWQKIILQSMQIALALYFPCTTSVCRCRWYGILMQASCHKSQTLNGAILELGTGLGRLALDDSLFRTVSVRSEKEL